MNAVNVTCVSCSAEYFLYNSNCVKECPTEKIMNIPHRTCDTCPQGYFKYDNRTCKCKFNFSKIFLYLAFKNK